LEKLILVHRYFPFGLLIFFDTIEYYLQKYSHEHKMCRFNFFRIDMQVAPIHYFRIRNTWYFFFQLIFYQIHLEIHKKIFIFFLHKSN
jgi:hypothetical protein